MSKYKGLWIGINVLYGGHFVAIGKVSSSALLFSAENPNKYFHLVGESWNVGPGLGGGIGVQIMFVTNCDHLHLLRTNSGFDIAVAMGANWAKIASMAKHTKGLKHVAKIIEKGQSLPNFIKISPDDVSALANYFSSCFSASGYSTGSSPNITTFDIPIPNAQLQLSATWGFTNFRVY